MKKALLGLTFLATVSLPESSARAQSAARFGVSGDRFTVDGAPTFLLGASYFDSVGWRASDLDGLKARRFNLLRIFLDYMPEAWDPSFAPRSRSYFNADGSMKNTQTLLGLVRACAARGIIVDATILWQVSNPGSAETAVRNAVRLLKDEPNVFYDLVNEHADDTAPGARWSHDHVPTMQTLFAAARAEDASAILTVSSSSGDWHIIRPDETLNTPNVDGELAIGAQIVTPHFPRTPDWYDRTDSRVRSLKNYLASVGRTVPVYLQEEARVDPTWIAPSQQHFLQAAREARDEGAAAWIFHTAAAFDLRASTWFDQLDATERATVDALGAQIYPPTDRPPVVSFRNPAAGATLTGAVAVNARASDPDAGPNDGDGILSVEFELRQGATVVASHLENFVTYDWTLDTTPFQNGAYTLRATATSAAAAGGTSAYIDLPVSISSVAPADGDGDGLADAWEMQYFGNLSQAPSSDADADGLTNLEEFQAGSDPTRPASSSGSTQKPDRSNCGATGMEVLLFLGIVCLFRPGSRE